MMALQNDLEVLRDRQERLRAQLAELRMTVAEDRPRDRDLALVDLRADALDDLSGLAAQSAEAGESARRSATPPADVAGLGRAILRCQTIQHALTERMWRDLLAFERVADLRQAARRHGGEWALWAASVEAALRGCTAALNDVGAALLGCWQGWIEWSDIDVGARRRNAPTREATPISRSK